jgi:ferric-dicitrate binding protein FerR (iron transport regulator)
MTELFYKYFAGTASREEERLLMDGVESSEAVRKSFYMERRLWDAFLLHTDADADEWMRARRRRPPAVRRLARPFARIAAMLALCFLAGMSYYWLASENTVQMLTVQAPAGGRTELLLGDGSRVCLNGGTVFSYPVSFDRKKRAVEISGEGYFEVAKGKAPFTVRSNRCEITVQGTVFNVKDYAGNAVSLVSLIEGAVKVRLRDRAQPEMILCAGEQAVFDSLTFTKERIDSYDVFLWREGYLVFDDTPFEEMTGALEKYYDVTFEVSNPRLRAYRCTGKFVKAEGIEHILKVLRKGVDFSYRIESNRIIIY